MTILALMALIPLLLILICAGYYARQAIEADLPEGFDLNPVWNRRCRQRRRPDHHVQWRGCEDRRAAHERRLVENQTEGQMPVG